MLLNIGQLILENQLDKEQKKELRKVKRITDVIDERETKSIGDGYGLCSGCKHLHFREFEHGHVVYALCGSYAEGFPTRLSKVHIVTKCSEYDSKGLIEIETMWAIATLIDVSEKKVIKGFIDNEVKVTKPDEYVTKDDIDRVTLFDDMED